MTIIMMLRVYWIDVKCFWFLLKFLGFIFLAHLTLYHNSKMAISLRSVKVVPAMNHRLVQIYAEITMEAPKDPLICSNKIHEIIRWMYLHLTTIADGSLFLLFMSS